MNEIMNYGGEILTTMMIMLYNCRKISTHQRGGEKGYIYVNLVKKGSKADLGNYKGITLLSTVGKTFL